MVSVVCNLTCNTAGAQLVDTGRLHGNAHRARVMLCDIVGALEARCNAEGGHENFGTVNMAALSFFILAAPPWVRVQKSLRCIQAGASNFGA
jgi:hypothetical protein